MVRFATANTVKSVTAHEVINTIEQDTGKPDITTTTAVRLLLDQAAMVEEALEVLGQYKKIGSLLKFPAGRRRGRQLPGR